MQRSSETIGAIAAALAKAQSELANPEKSLTATIRASHPRESARTASLQRLGRFSIQPPVPPPVFVLRFRLLRRRRC